MRYVKKPQQNQKRKGISGFRANSKNPPTKSDSPGSYMDCWGDDPFLTSIDVPDSEATPTGILDADGNEYYRTPNPIGFIWY